MQDIPLYMVASPVHCVGGILIFVKFNLFLCRWKPSIV